MTDLTSSPTALKQQRTPSNSGVPRSTKNKTPQSKLEQAEKIDDTKASIQEEVESQADTSNVEEGSEADEEEGTEVSLFSQKPLTLSMLFQRSYAPIRYNQYQPLLHVLDHD